MDTNNQVGTLNDYKIPVKFFLTPSLPCDSTQTEEMTYIATQALSLTSSEYSYSDLTLSKESVSSMSSLYSSEEELFSLLTPLKTKIRTVSYSKFPILKTREPVAAVPYSLAQTAQDDEEESLTPRSLTLDREGSSTPPYIEEPPTTPLKNKHSPLRAATPVFDEKGNIVMEHSINQKYWMNISEIMRQGIVNKEQLTELINNPPAGFSSAKFFRTLSEIGKELMHYTGEENLYFKKASPQRPHAFTLSKRGKIYITSSKEKKYGLTKAVAHAYELVSKRFYTRTKSMDKASIPTLWEENQLLTRLHEETPHNHFAEPFELIIESKKDHVLEGLIMHQKMYTNDGRGISAAYPKQVAKFTLDIALGIAELHHKGFAFCDIKPANGVYEGEEASSTLINAYLIDFGTVTKVGEKRKGGTLAYLSSELYQQTMGVVRHLAQKEDDAFALGASLMEMLFFPNKKIIWGDKSSQRYLQEAMRMTSPHTLQRELLQIASKLMGPINGRPSCAKTAEYLQETINKF